MTLDVRTDALRRAARTYGQLSDDVAAARSYTSRHLELGEGVGIFVNAKAVNDRVRDHLETLFDQVKATLHGSERELVGAAHLYDTTDHAAAQRMDGTYRAVDPLPTGSTYADVHGSYDNTHPEEEDYVPPEQDDGGGDGEPAPGGGGGGESW